MNAIDWTFYYVTTDGIRHVVGNGAYKKPDHTKLYKETHKFLGKDNVKGIGYCRTNLLDETL